MFTTQKMFLMDLLILEKHKEAVSKSIVEAGILEPSVHSYFAKDSAQWAGGGAPEGKKMIADYERYAGELNAFFSPYAPDGAKAPDSADAEALAIPIIGDLLRQYQNKYSSYNTGFSTLKKRKEGIAVQMAGMRMYNNADEETQKSFHNPESIYSVLGVIHSGNLPLLQHEFEQFKGTLLNEGHVDDSEIIFIAVSRDQVKDLNALLERVYFVSYGLPAEFFGKGSPNMMRLGLEFTLACDEESILEDACKKEAPQILASLRRIERSIQLYNKVSDITSSSRSAGQFVLITGWVSGSEIKNLKAVIQKMCGDKYEMHISDSDYFSIDTEIPTKLSNPSVFKPFETLVTLFGVPHYREIDPTPFMAVLYTIMYGAMFGDVGHGGVLFVVGLFGLIFKKSPLRLIFSLMVWVGLSSVVFGFMYGSIFGYEDILHHWWISPMKQTNQLLLYSVIFGIGVILLGFVLGIVNIIRMRNWPALIFSHKGLVAFSIYLQLLFIGYLIHSGVGIHPVFYWVLGSTVLFLGLERVWDAFFYGHGQYSEAWMGVFDLFEFFLSLVSNTISFVRVGAFALTHGALMLAIFSLQKLAGNPIAANMILIGGNLFVIFFEGFIVGIQTLRLEYYEFFIRFFKGSGRFFKPVAMDKKGE